MRANICVVCRRLCCAFMGMDGWIVEVCRASATTTTKHYVTVVSLTTLLVFVQKKKRKCTFRLSHKLFSSSNSRLSNSLSHFFSRIRITNKFELARFALARHASNACVYIYVCVYVKIHTHTHTCVPSYI